MPESNEHSNLVALLYSYIADRFYEGDGTRVLTDSADNDSLTRPPSISGYVPDSYVMLNDIGAVAIGEAKSFGDFDNPRTAAQVTAFMRRCALAEGSVLVLAVPWPLERVAKTLINNLKTRQGLLDVELVVLSDANPMGTIAPSRRSMSCKS